MAISFDSSRRDETRNLLSYAVMVPTGLVALSSPADQHSPPRPPSLLRAVSQPRDSMKVEMSNGTQLGTFKGKIAEYQGKA